MFFSRFSMCKVTIFFCCCSFMRFFLLLFLIFYVFKISIRNIGFLVFIKRKKKKKVTTAPFFCPVRTARCTVYVQYMYSICTLRKRTNTVHILYIYCTTGGAGGVKAWLSAFVFRGQKIFFLYFSNQNKMRIFAALNDKQIFKNINRIKLTLWHLKDK